MFSVDFESQPNLDIFFIISAARGVYYYNILIVGKLFMNRSMCDLANYFAQKSHEYSTCLQKKMRYISKTRCVFIHQKSINRSVIAQIRFF